MILSAYSSTFPQGIHKIYFCDSYEKLKLYHG